MDCFDFLNVLEREVAGMQAAVSGVDLDLPVPPCPGWTVRDLVVHTSIVHRHKTAVVRDRLTEGPPDEPDDPEGDAFAWFNEGVDEMLAVFREADLSAPTWTWCLHDHSAEWWVRRMAHETLIHRVDAEIAAGGTPWVDEKFAVDGIEEILVEFMAEAPDWGELTEGDSTLALVSPERSWTLRTATWSGRSPNTGNVHEDEPSVVVIDRAENPDATISGTAAELDLWLWGRGELSENAVRGDVSLAGFVRAIAVEATQ